MKCSTYASSTEALDPASIPFHGASLEGNLHCCASFFQPRLCWFHTYVVSVSVNTAKHAKPSKATNIICF